MAPKADRPAASSLGIIVDDQAADLGWALEGCVPAGRASGRTRLGFSIPAPGVDEVAVFRVMEQKK